MSNPYENTSDRRYSADEILEIISDKNHICYCGNEDLICRPYQETFPKDPEWVSHCDIYECPKCGRKWEWAYTLCYTMCLLKSGKYEQN